MFKKDTQVVSKLPEFCTYSKLVKIVKNFPKIRVLVIGDFILDEFVWGSVDRISPEAPVPVVSVNRETFMPGGALNVAHNIRTLKSQAVPCGIVGRDLWGRMLAKEMRRQGIETGGVIYDSGRRTTLKTRVIAHSQQVVRFDREDVQEMKKEDSKKVLEFVKQAIPKVDAVIIEDYGKGMITSDLLTMVVREAKKVKKPVLVDPKEKHFDYYKGVTCLTPNRKEAFAAYGRSESGKPVDLLDVGRSLLDRFESEAVLVTMGEDGMMVFERNGPVTKIPTAAKEVYDVSGAGDTVIAVFSMALAAGASMREAAVISNYAAGVVVGKIGTATLTPEELIASFPAGARKHAQRRKRTGRHV